MIFFWKEYQCGKLNILRIKILQEMLKIFLDLSIFFLHSLFKSFLCFFDYWFSNLIPLLKKLLFQKFLRLNVRHDNFFWRVVKFAINWFKTQILLYTKLFRSHKWIGKKLILISYFKNLIFNLLFDGSHLKKILAG